MADKGINSETKTGRIHIKIFELLEQNPNGVRWVDLLKNLEGSNPDFHPKTLNGCIWKLTQNFPDKVYKPSKGLFRLRKFEAKDEEKV